MTFKYGSFCSGVDGFAQVLNRLGGECVIASEIDEYVEKAYKAIYGHGTWGDLTAISEYEVPDMDVLVAGFPCQSFSVAGERLGFEDTRGTVFFEIARIAEHKQPKAMILENVKGLVNHDGGKTLDTILFTLNDIGYTVDFRVMNTKYFGLPQHRERIYIVAVRNDLVKDEIIKVNKKEKDIVGKARLRAHGYVLAGKLRTFNFDFPNPQAVTKQLKHILEPEVEDKYFLSEETTKTLVTALKEKGKQVEVMDDGLIMIGMLDTKGHDNIRRVYDADGLAPTLTAVQGGNHEAKILEDITDQVVFSVNGQGISYNIDANYWKGQSPSQVDNAKRTHIIEVYGRYYRIRKLTPKECFRLQGFDDSIVETLYEAGLKNTRLYRMAGNAVSLPVVEGVATPLLKLLEVI